MRADYGTEVLEGPSRQDAAPNNAIISLLQFKKSKRVTVRLRHEIGAHGVGLKSRSHLTRVDAKGHRRFFVREIHKG